MASNRLYLKNECQLSLWTERVRRNVRSSMAGILLHPDVILHAREGCDFVGNEVFLHPSMPFRSDLPIWDSKSIFRLSKHEYERKNIVRTHTMDRSPTLSMVR